ncbi:hypothetical protein [Pseudomonas syringae]|uniref:hypothetical protein n=1 Tax=Pseudomonas syringae TaxID=317 RepID=UPI000CF10C5C|nr:hypothetical protein [Pseudomonas syringae]MCF5198944.1 hypothetical protein [Pseudomonas syringae]MCF5208981.1 hypothetical protein [Pseudomonas syringae]MCF5214020.1 hypothetical protein [Pseudomonas syringae]MCF5219620.1 hypothetical protein [Pseudomonas syringae]MCF5267223.1 hypothetical protein [Pseudomonas syringae]
MAYSKEERHIEWLAIFRLVESNLSFFSFVGRPFVVDLINSGAATFRSATINSRDKSFAIGATVHVYDGEFLTTSPDKSESNNLENLPEFVMPDDDIDEAAIKAFPILFRLQ